MNKHINKDNEWEKALRKGKVPFDNLKRPPKKEFKFWQVSNKQRRGVNSTNVKL